MDKLFYPESVAVVGVSSSITNLAKRILFNLRRFHFTGRVYGVGPRDEDVEGFRLFPSIKDIPDSIDLAVLLVPANSVPKVVEECGEKGIRHLVIESGGFRELDGVGSATEEKLLHVCAKYGIRFVGPNCIGIINRENGLCTPFARLLSPFHEGGISVISQSGGVGQSYITELTSEFVGLNKFISFGNGLNIDEVDLVEYLSRDPGTKVISCYLEGLSRGRELLRVVSRMNKPVVMLKSNTHERTHYVAASHSAALSGDEQVLDAALRQVGALRVMESQEWANVTKQLTMPLMRGNRLAILSRSGGHAVLATDAAHHFGFEIPPFPPEFFEACSPYFQKSVIRLQNPLDMGQVFFHPAIAHIMEECLKLDTIDGVLLIHTYDAEQENDLAHLFLSQILPKVKKYNKPVTLVLYTQRAERHFVRETYRLPLFRTPYQGVQALAHSRDAVKGAARRRAFDATEKRVRNQVRADFLAKVKNEGRSILNLNESLEFMNLYGIPLAPHHVVSTQEEAVKAADKLGYPVALKLVHDEASHKTDTGGVQLNLKNEDGLRSGWSEIASAAKKAGLSGGLTCAVVQKMSSQGWEMFLGAKRDVNFGPIVMVGSGGILAEVVRDVAVRVSPINREDAEEMLQETKAVKLLDGFRGSPPADKKALIDLLLLISGILLEHDDIVELDLNPVFVHPENQGLTIVDARIVLVSNTATKE